MRHSFIAGIPTAQPACPTGLSQADQPDKETNLLLNQTYRLVSNFFEEKKAQPGWLRFLQRDFFWKPALSANNNQN